MSVIFEAENYRGLKKVRWAPSGVCALVGPNGSGKTTLLELPELFRYAVQRGFNEAVGLIGGFWGLKNLDAGDTDPVQIRVFHESSYYSINVLTGLSHGIASIEETLADEQDRILHKPFDRDVALFGTQSTPILLGKLALTTVADRFGYPNHTSMVKELSASATFSHYGLTQLSENGSRVSGDVTLVGNGTNAFSVLRNWSGAFAHKHRYAFVVESLRRAFPGLFQDLEFEPGSTSVSVKYQQPGRRHAFPISVAPDGLLVGLLQLCAVAGADGGYVGIDEFENSLHPHAIRSIIGSIREWCEDKDITVVLATHSPVVMDEFNDDKENLFVMQPGREVQPAAVTELADREWLDQFALGRLYTGGEIGSPNRVNPKPEPTAA